jgi:prevent-host-death family protein
LLQRRAEEFIMKTNKLTSREFNQDTGGAKRAAQSGPVYITDRGRPSHVLLTFESYKRLAANQTSMIELLSEPRGIEDIDFEIPVIGDAAEPARFD